MSKQQEHFRQILASYGTVDLIDYGGEAFDHIFVKAWGCHVKVLRLEGATEPDYRALFFAVEHWGYGHSAGVQDGKAEAFKELRQLIGAREQD